MDGRRAGHGLARAVVAGRGGGLTRHRTAVTAAAAPLLVALAGLAAVLAVQARANAPARRPRSAQLDAANVREAERFDLAMDAIKLFHGEVSEDLLLKEKKFDGLRTKLLRGAADFYGKLEGLLGAQADRESRGPLAKALRRARRADRRDRQEARGPGRAPQGPGRPPRAGRRGRRRTRGRRSTSPGACVAIGHAQEVNGDFGSARASYEEAARLAEAVEAAGRPTERRGPTPGAALYNLGGLLLITRNPTEALAVHKRAPAIRDRLADAHPAATAVRGRAVQSQFAIGILLFDLSRPGRGPRVVPPVRGDVPAIGRRRSRRREARRHLAQAYHNTATLLMRIGRPAEAMELLRRELESTNGSSTRTPPSRTSSASCRVPTSPSASCPGG